MRGVSLPLLLLLIPAALHAQREPVRLLVVAGAQDSVARAGAELGLAEAARTAELLGTVVEARIVAPGNVEDTGTPDFVISLVDGAGAARIAHATAAPVLNAGAPAEDLGDAACLAHVHHIAPTRRMIDDALRLTPEGDSAVAWHGSLERYGAQQLNDRFRARTGRDMDGAAWAAWLAVKVAAETALRPGESAARLARAQFDGHKGKPLSFRAWDRVLRQPLYVLQDGGTTEVPRTERGDTTPAAALLDRIGAAASESACAGD